MSSTSQDNPSRADDSSNWRALLPHLPASSTIDLRDLVHSTTANTGPSKDNAALTKLFDGLDPNVFSLEHRAVLHSIQGALSTSRERLLSTTAVLIDQRSMVHTTREALIHFRNEIPARIVALADEMDIEHANVEAVIQANIRHLNELGESEANVASILKAMGATGLHAVPVPPLPIITEFDRRACLLDDSKRPAAAAFAFDVIDKAPSSDLAVLTARPAKTARFGDQTSLPMGPRY
ncbi:hypothetical protein C8R44DRAFT_877730 [Mycena epipterygia]|nr:hypothetical protein C8R44DRAFT_893800 [Mycena epipterygia]KAJ7120289.1 hypothetical protein C8R44DRAFT_877730 [Mycena epipterygia]